jgi:hypothetical protein
MVARRFVYAGVGAALWLGACAQGSNQGELGADAQQAGGADASMPADAATALNDAASSAADAAAQDAMTPAPDAMAPVPDAMPDATPCTDVVVQLLANADFDEGSGGAWVEASLGGYALVYAAPSDELALAPHSGGYLVWLGGYLNSVDVLQQDVMVPEGARDLHLVGQRLIGTQESGPLVYDTVAIELRTTGNALLETLGGFSNVNAVGTWTPFSFSATGQYGGQQIRLRLHAQTDFSDNTNFFFDTFALRATVCQ